MLKFLIFRALSIVSSSCMVWLNYLTILILTDMSFFGMFFPGNKGTVPRRTRWGGDLKLNCCGFSGFVYEPCYWVLDQLFRVRLLCLGTSLALACLLHINLVPFCLLYCKVSCCYCCGLDSQCLMFGIEISNHQGLIMLFCNLNYIVFCQFFAAVCECQRNVIIILSDVWVFGCPCLYCLFHRS